MEPFPYDYGKQLFLENAVKLHLLNLRKHSKIFKILAKYSSILASKLCEYTNPDVFANTTIGTTRTLQISKMDSFATTFNGFSPLNIVSNLFIWGVWKCYSNLIRTRKFWKISQSSPKELEQLALVTSTINSVDL